MLSFADFERLSSPDPDVKYGFVRELLAAAKTDPAGLYPYLDLFSGHLFNPNKILQWTAIDMVGYLSACDLERKTDLLLKKITALLHSGQLITCNHAIFSLGLIAQNKPYLREDIIRELLDVSNDTFKTGECKNIATGKVIDVLNKWPSEVKGNKRAEQFVLSACHNTRNATKKLAETPGTENVPGVNIPDTTDLSQNMPIIVFKNIQSLRS